MRNLFFAGLFFCALAGAQTFTTIANFTGLAGAIPEGPLIQNSDGNFWGLTEAGGAFGVGTIFAVTPGGTIIDIYDFAFDPNDGSFPNGGLVRGPDGNFYGTTQFQGAREICCGTVFRVTPAGKLTTIYQFSTGNTDGFTPTAPLTLGADGNLYGTTSSGGINGGGTVFRMTTGGGITVLYSFGYSQSGVGGLTMGLIQAADGNFYGITKNGGQFAKGSIFRVTPNGAFTLLYSFNNAALGTGEFPNVPLTLGTDGNIYGLTNSTLFRMTLTGSLSIIAANLPGVQGGAILQANDGNFYGASNGIFRVTPSGAVSILYPFNVNGQNDGGPPSGAMIQGKDLNFYGVMANGGGFSYGTVYRFIPPKAAPTGTTPSISTVINAFSNSTTIGPNTWVAIKGSNLSPSGDSRIWQGSDFLGGQMPVSLDGVSVTMNGSPAYMYFISSNQLNVLTPPDLAPGPVQVQVTVGSQSSPYFASQAADLSLGFFVFNGGPYVIGTHLNGTDLGPTYLFPNYTTPAAAGETIILYGNGFGSTTVPVTKGSASQGGSLPATPVILIGGTQAQVTFAGLVSPGLYQFNVIAPPGLASGDNSLSAQYGGQTTQSGVLLTIH